MTDDPKWYDAHLEEYQKTALVRSQDEYDRRYRESVDSPEIFWARQAEKYLDWIRPWDTVLDYDFDAARIEWFGGGKLNASAN